MKIKDRLKEIKESAQLDVIHDELICIIEDLLEEKKCTKCGKPVYIDDLCGECLWDAGGIG